MKRREFVGAAGIVPVVAVAGCTSEADDPKSAAEIMVEGMDEGDPGKVNSVIADEGEIDGWGESDAEFVEGFDVRMSDFEILEEEDDRVEAQIQISMTNGSTESNTIVYEMREIDGEWLFWDVVSAPQGPQSG